MSEGSNSIFTGPQSGITVMEDGSVYGYSGAVSDAGGGGSFNTTVFDFTTGKDPMKINLNYTVYNGTTENIYVRVLLNGSQVWSTTYADHTVLNGNGNLPVSLILPPLSNFKMLWGIDSVTRDIFAVITGKVMK